MESLKPTQPPHAENEGAGERPRRCLLVVNPRSRNGDQNASELMTALQRQGVAVYNDAPIDIEDLSALLRDSHDRIQADSDRILLGGGDGTINQVLPDLVRAGLPMAIAPLGTANDLARTLGVPESPEEVAAMLVAGRVTRIDLGRVNDKLYANVASIGLGPRVTEALSQELKARLGVLGYPRALLAAYREIKPFVCRLRVDDGAEYRQRAIHLAVGNGRFYGGGAAVFEEAAIDDNRLDLYALAPIPLWRLLLVGPWLKDGRHRELQDVHITHGQRISVHTSRPLPISADGEILTHTPAEFEVLPRALPVVIPAGVSTTGLQRDNA